MLKYLKNLFLCAVAGLSCGAFFAFIILHSPNTQSARQVCNGDLCAESRQELAELSKLEGF